MSALEFKHKSAKKSLTKKWSSLKSIHESVAKISKSRKKTIVSDKFARKIKWLFFKRENCNWGRNSGSFIVSSHEEENATF